MISADVFTVLLRYFCYSCIGLIIKDVTLKITMTYVYLVNTVKIEIVQICTNLPNLIILLLIS